MSDRGALSIEEDLFGASLEEDLFGFKLVDASGSQSSRPSQAKAKTAPTTGVRYYAVSKISVKAVADGSKLVPGVYCTTWQTLHKFLCEANFSCPAWNSKALRSSRTR